MLFLSDAPGSGALTLAEDIRVLISESDFIEGRSVTVSIGLSERSARETLDRLDEVWGQSSALFS